MKKFFTLIILCIFSIGVIHADITWTLSNDGTLTISGTDMPDYSSGKTPWYNQRDKIKKVVIEAGITNIGSGAFHDCMNVTSVTIPNSVTDIGSSAFSECKKVTSFNIPNSVTSIGSHAFCECSSLTSITIPNSVTSIGQMAFFGCSGLTSITIPESVTRIEASTFLFCSKLTSITIPESVISIGNSAFNGTKWYNNQPDGLVYVGLVLYKYKGTMPENTKIEIKNGTKGIAASAFDGCSNLTSITIPNSMINIEKSVFQNCSGLTSVIVGNSVISIGEYAFYGCSGLTSITIPNSVTSIGEQVFYGCSALTSITIPNSMTSIENQAFYGCSGLTSITIPNSVTSIGEQVFYGCSALTSITIPNSMTSIGNQAFDGCSGLTSITIPNSVTSIGGGAFYQCSALASVTIPNSVTSIGNGAFYECSSLTSITIPESVTNIGASAFDGTKLRNIVIKSKTPPSGEENAFSKQSYYHTALMIPEGSWDAYAYSNNWYQFINIREMAYNEANLTNSKAYMMKSATEGSYLFYDSVNDCVGELNETALDDTEKNNTWMTVEVEGKHYVYNLGAKKFLESNKANTGYSLSDTSVSIDIEDGRDAIVFGKSKEFYMVINDKLNVVEGLESQIATTTGINEIDVESNLPIVTYNLNGQRINKSSARKGIFIVNGKKYTK